MSAVPLSLSELVARAGYVSARAEYMELVLECAIQTLQVAESALAGNWKTFCAKKGALRKPRKGAKRAVPRPDENALTYEIGDYIHQHMKSLPAEHKYRGNVHFVFEKPQPSRRLAGGRRKRQDLRYEAYIVDGPELVIEAKPLLRPSDVKKRYLGDEGLKRFVRDEEPLTDDDLGAMIGYVPAARASEWDAAIRSAVVSESGCDLVIDVGLEGWGDACSSQHRRSGARAPIWMLHLLVKYPAVSV